MTTEQQQLHAGIAALEVQRTLLGDAVVDAAIAGLRARIAALSPLAAPSHEPAQTLKQVSILFLDVVGSTSLSQRLDPEAISAVMDDALARGTAIVEAHRGKVLQYAGDNILAAFGADEAREDDAERAVHCALALLELGRRLGAEVQAEHGHAGFDVRVGVHTGGVLLGAGVDADGSIRGIAVNVAARMEQTAPPGALRISHDTYVQVRGLFEVEAQEPLAVKGVDAPVPSYLVRRARPRSFRLRTRGIEGVATRMIGRDAAFSALQSAFERLFVERRFAAVTVVAEAGLGKSRLLDEFAAWSEARPERFLLFRGRATPQTGTQAFGLLRDILAWRFQINDDDSVDTARRKMEQGIVALFVQDDGPELAEGHAHLLGHLIGIEWKDSRHIRGILDDARQIRNRAFHAAAQLFRRLSAAEGMPVVLHLEDLHWADGESLDFLAHLCDVGRDVPLLLLAFTRPTLFERGAAWFAQDTPAAAVHRRIELAPLDAAGSDRLAGELLQKLPEVPHGLRELLTRSAEGNPFYMEELVRMLIDRGAIQTGGGTWAVNTERLRVSQVPGTLTGVLQARLDGLPAGEKRALQDASVVGAVFWDQALAAVDPQAVRQLPALTERALTLPRAGTALEGLREYAFQHQLLHQVTYDTVLRRTKREGHARVAQWLAGLGRHSGLRAGDVLGLAAGHFEQAGDQAQAAEFHARAAEQAGQRMAHERVLVHVDRALSLLGTALPHQADLRWRLLSVRERTLALQARRDAQAADLDALSQLAELLDDDQRRALVALRRGARAQRNADWGALAAAAQDALRCATRARDVDLRLRALRLLALALVSQGDIEPGRSLAQEGLAEARQHGLRDTEGRLLNVLAVAAAMQGDAIGALDMHRQGLQFTQEIGDRANEVVSLVNIGEGWMTLGELSQARRHLDAALQRARANGQRVMEAAACGHLSMLALWQGDGARALAMARAALALAVATQARDYEVQAGLRLGDAELALGQLADARRSLGAALQRALDLDDPMQHDASAALARVALAEGDAAGALAALQALLQHVAAGGTLDGADLPRCIELTCHQALARAGDARAADWLSRAHGALIAQAGRFGDDRLRQGFLQNIPHHREIVAAWARRGAGKGSPAGGTA